MKKFTICYMVTGGITVEAESEEEAMTRFNAGEFDEQIGQTLAENEVTFSEIYEDENEEQIPEQIPIKDVGLYEYCSIIWPPDKENTLLRVNTGDDREIIFYNCDRPLFVTRLDALVYPLSREQGKAITNMPTPHIK